VQPAHGRCRQLLETYGLGPTCQRRPSFFSPYASPSFRRLQNSRARSYEPKSCASSRFKVMNHAEAREALGSLPGAHPI
jgi:hypothetical protein